MDVLHAIEVSFRLGPGTLEDARAIAARLAAEAVGCRDEMLFVDAEGGVYGYLALWAEEDEAGRFRSRPGVGEQLAALEQRLGRPPTTRYYAVERPGEARTL
jgi:hypothetical protein